MIRFTLAAIVAGASVFGPEDIQAEKTARFLEAVATVEVGQWNQAEDQMKQEFPDLLAEKSVSEALSTLSPKIIDGNRLDLISLLQRAITNCSELSGEKTSPFVYRYKNYEAPPFLIPKTELIIDVKQDIVAVTSTLFIKPNGNAHSLVLNGRGHTVRSVSINKELQPRESYRVTPNELILPKIPEGSFEVEVRSEIDPYHNETLEGLYQTGSFLITQCEAESARQIFYTLDRPDVLSRIQTTIIADPTLYPVRISNGNLVAEEILSDGRKKIVWDDPIPKPSYLFACTLGDFGKVSDVYITKSGQTVDLDVFVEKGKEARALYSLEALKKAMEFDEKFFDREYDLTSLKMVAVAGFNMGAMENKGLMVFNERYLLVSKDSGTDSDFRAVASVVAHEYFHNWSGNRVTVRNWFELALKEAFTDFRAMLFSEWLFGKAFVRPKEVKELRDRQFPEERSELGHPIMVESYVSPSEIYDSTTYTKGREVFRTLQTYLDLLIPDGFRKAQNLYFSRYDGQAVTFRELLQSANEILLEAQSPDLSQFERWFNQQGTPQILAQVGFDKQARRLTLTLEQSCPHPKTGADQPPLLIPFTYEFLRLDGRSATGKQTLILTDKVHTIQIPAEEKLIPIFLHDYGAPVILNYPYTSSELAIIMRCATDPFTAWEAGQNFHLLAMQKADFRPMAAQIKAALEEKSLSALAKAQLLSLPSLRTMSERFAEFDFPKLQKLRDRYKLAIASSCKDVFTSLLLEYPAPTSYAPITEQMEIRELRHIALYLLSQVERRELARVYQDYIDADHFDTSLQSLRILVEGGGALKDKALASYHSHWKGDTAAICHWLTVQCLSPKCTVDDVKKAMKAEGFDPKNPNHIRATVGAYAQNLARFHDPSGDGYRFLTDQIIATAQYNPSLSFNLAKLTFIDFEKLPEKQKKLLAAQSKRLLSSDLPPEVYELLNRVAAAK